MAWETKRMKDLFELNPILRKKGIDAECNVSFVPMECLRCGNIEKRIAKYDDVKSYTPFQNGDLLMAKVTPCFENGNIAIAENLENGIGFGSSEIFVLRSKSIFIKYAFFLSLSNVFHSIGCPSMKGVGGLKRIDPTHLLGSPVRVPSLSEQQRIASYLDKQTASIDSRIALLEKKKEKYLILRKAVINEAVIGTENDKKISWLGEIPNHWNIVRVKEIFSESDARTETGEEDLLSVSEYYGVARRQDKMSEDDEYETRADSLVGYKICKKGDLVINIMLAWKCGLGISDYEGIVSPSYAVYKSKGVNPKYYHYLFRTDKAVAEFKRNSKGIIDSRLRMYSDRFFNIFIPVPPIAEQDKIVKFLDQKTSQIDTIVSKITDQIENLKVLRKCIINESVRER